MDVSGRAAPAAVFVAFLTPFVDQYAGILIAAMVGSLYPLAAAQTETRWDGVKLVFRVVLTAMVLAGAAAWLLESKVGVPAHVATPTGTFFLALVGDRWGDIKSAVVKRFLQFVGGEQ
jgi:hypothetical protein